MKDTGIKIYRLLVLLLMVVGPFVLGTQAQSWTFRLKNTLGFDRVNELVEVKLPEGTSLQGKQLVDEKGAVVPYQACGDTAILFRATVGYGTTAAYTLQEGTPATLTKLTYVAQKMPSSRNDIAWENDLAAYRMYSRLLQNSEPNTANGVDLWQKKVADPIIEKMYAASNYHNENDYGVDAYSVNGKTLGAGGVAAYTDGKLWMHDAYDECIIIENDALRSVFELTYNNVVVNGKSYTKTLRVETVAGGLLNKATVRYEGPAQDMKMAVCIYQHTNMGGVSPEGRVYTDVPGLIGYAENKSEGSVTSSGARFFLGAYIPSDSVQTQIIDHHLTVMCDYAVGTDLVYYFGGGWNIFPADTYSSDDDWFDALYRFRQAVDEPMTTTSMVTLPRKDEVIDLIHRVNNHWQSTHPTHGDFFWNRAVYHTGNMEAYAVTGDATYLDYSYAWAEKNNWCGAPGTDKSKWKYTYGEGGDYVLFGDCQICFQVYADLYNESPSEFKIARAREVMEYEMSTSNVDYLWWVDGLYMVMPVMTRLYKITGNELYLQKMYEYWKYATDLMYDEEAGLYYRDAKYIYPSHKTNSGKKDFWARGDGWIFAAFARVLTDLPLDDPHRDEYIKVYRRMARAVADAQQSEGHWTRSMLDPAYAPGYETSGTALFTYGYLWGFNNGILSELEYGATVQRAWNYLTTVALQDNNVVGYVQPIGEKADPNQTVSPGSTSDFGVGAFLLAASEMARYGVGDLSVPALRISSVQLTDANRLVVVYNDAPDAAEVLNTAYYTLNGNALSGTIQYDGERTATIILAKPLDYGCHTLAIEGLKSQAGGEMVGVQSRTLVYVVPLTPSPSGIVVTAVGNQSGNSPANTVDNSLDTRWSQAGLGQWIRYDLGSIQDVEAVDIAFYSGTQRKSYFDIQVSEDGNVYSTALSSCVSSGLTDKLERFVLPEIHKARYVRIMCNGNSSGGENWNSITELRIRVRETVLQDLSLPTEVYGDILLPMSTNAGNVIVWTSSHPDVLSSTGLVTSGEVEEDVTLTATVGLQQRQFEVKVMPRDISKALRLFYPFNTEDVYVSGNTRKLTDHSSYGRDAIVYGSAVIDGTLNLTANTAASFSTNGYVKVPQGVLDTLRSYTFMVTITPKNLNKQPRLYDFGSSSGNSIFLRANALSAGIKYNSGTTKMVNSSKALSVATEQNVAVTFDARTQTTRIYINGEKVAEGTTVTNEPYELSALKDDTRNYIGRTQWWESSVKGDNLDYCGTMDNFRLYGIVLTEKELMDVYEDDATALSQVHLSTDIRLSAQVVTVGEEVSLEGTMFFDEAGTVELFDARGRQVYVASVASLPQSFRADVPAGMYFIRVMKGTEQVFTSKLLVR